MEGHARGIGRRERRKGAPRFPIWTIRLLTRLLLEEEDLVGRGLMAPLDRRARIKHQIRPAASRSWSGRMRIHNLKPSPHLICFSIFILTSRLLLLSKIDIHQSMTRRCQNIQAVSSVIVPGAVIAPGAWNVADVLVSCRIRPSSSSPSLFNVFNMTRHNRGDLRTSITETHTRPNLTIHTNSLRAYLWPREPLFFVE